MKCGWQAEHENVKTAFFATDCIEDMHVWMHAMNQAATVQMPAGYLTVIHFAVPRVVPGSSRIGLIHFLPWMA